MKHDSVLNDVINYNNGHFARFHMPGHKGRRVGGIFDDIYGYDVTELEQTGNLYTPEGGAESSLRFAAELYGTRATVYSAGGATLCIQAALAAAMLRSGGKKVMCGRNCHLSALNAMALLGLDPVWFYPEDEIPDIPEDCCAVFVTSPDYYGKMIGLDALAQRSADKNIPLICDNAHGAHLKFFRNGSLHPLSHGAELVIDSLHKTVPALTGAALLHSKSMFSAKELLYAMKLFGSTSPSYLVSSSIDVCLNYMSEHGEKDSERLYRQVELCRETLDVYGYSFPYYPLCDPFRLCIRDENAAELNEIFIADGVIPEFCDGENIVFIPSVMSTEEDFLRLEAAAARFVPSLSEIKPEVRLPLPEKAMTVREGLLSFSVKVPIAEAIGRISAEAKAPYPPGVPAVMPGEVIRKQVADYLASHGITEIRIIK